ncbi:hypothetical protein BJ508DRAFT_101264 [Ascobolus immersus RN42]|uniref:Polysaccharide pyruvyl transferase domain-containing protein n=1 Tax=Ascobolus immersus RN42 TaxID=1160509 RepID=A0A3N4I9J4_ASCIM|nr:hypothetical protein BJ508DRAFT_101264 [Ascobolus immersus RN42]
MFGFKTTPSAILPAPSSPRLRSRTGLRLKMFSLPRRTIFIFFCGVFLITLLTIVHQLQLTTSQVKNYTTWIRDHGGHVSVAGDTTSTATTAADLPGSTEVYIQEQLEVPPPHDPSSPPDSKGCEALVESHRKTLLNTFSKSLRPYTTVNLLANPPITPEDAFISVSQSLLLQHLGITISESCSTPKTCNFTDPTLPILISSPSSPSLNPLEKPSTPLLTLLQSGNIQNDTPIHGFPLPHRHLDPIRTKETLTAYHAHQNLHLTASDSISHSFLTTNFPGSSGLQSHLIPDITFFLGSRPDLKSRYQRRVDVLILGSGTSWPDPKEDWINKWRSLDIKKGFWSVKVDFRPHGINETGEWTPDQTYKEGDKWHADPRTQTVKTWRGTWSELTDADQGDDWKRTLTAMEHIASARLVITDRLHVHIMATILNIPHILLDRSSEGVLLDHDVWTRTCGNVRVVGSIEDAWDMAKGFLGANGGGLEWLVGEGRRGSDMVEE